MLLFVIALGGAAGALARYGLGGWVQRAAGATFPWGTLVINITGSLLLGFLVRYLEGVIAPAEWRGFLTIGFCGAYTTFSTYSFETATLLQDGEWKPAAGYVLASVFVSLAGTFAGFMLAALALRAQG